MTQVKSPHHILISDLVRALTAIKCVQFVTASAGTGYLAPSSFVESIEFRFARTQVGGIGAQLECGSRAFDWRPYQTANGTFGFFHGPIVVNHSMVSAASEVVAWANAHAGEAEDALVLLVVADCTSEDPNVQPACNANAAAAFQSVGVPIMVGDAACAAASDWTVGAAMTASALSGGGHAIALIGCPTAHVNTYDDRLSCTGFTNVTQGNAFEAEVSACVAKLSPSELYECVLVVLGVLDVPDHFACYASEPSASLAFDRLLQWNVNCTSVPPPVAPGQRGLLTSIQGCWAQNTQSTILSFLHNSSLIDDEVRANFNRVLAQWLAPGTPGAPPTLKYVNLVGLNNVCDFGAQLLPILRARLPGEDDERPWLL